ncbi:MAG: hypothetical protein N2748_06390, partial [candidate division WOR-3 bacterium]|nr:hypothetical protein [candidate division WOR-3 bacterium]
MADVVIDNCIELFENRFNVDSTSVAKLRQGQPAKLRLSLAPISAKGLGNRRRELLVGNIVLWYCLIFVAALIIMRVVKASRLIIKSVY